MFPSLPFHCPISPGHYEAFNVTFANGETSGYIPHVDIQLPNGLHRHIVITSTKTDPTMFRLEWTNEVNKRLGEDNI